MGYIRAVCISEKKGTGKKNVGEAVFIEDEGLKGMPTRENGTGR